MRQDHDETRQVRPPVVTYSRLRARAESARRPVSAGSPRQRPGDEPLSAVEITDVQPPAGDLDVRVTEEDRGYGPVDGARRRRRWPLRIAGLAIVVAIAAGVGIIAGSLDVITSGDDGAFTASGDGADDATAAPANPAEPDRTISLRPAEPAEAATDTDTAAAPVAPPAPRPRPERTASVEADAPAQTDRAEPPPAEANADFIARIERVLAENRDGASASAAAPPAAPAPLQPAGNGL